MAPSGPLCGKRRRGAPCHKNVAPELDQFGDELRQPLEAAVGRAVIDDKVLSFDIAELPHAGPKRANVRSVERD